ncbi:MAG: fibronectin type III domain-containing protein [Bacilli bacterium]|nr:fibronectin type III domain-containing protein [Bacilli bacterium]
MRFETLEKKHRAGIIVGVVALICIMIVRIFAASRANYQSSQSVALVRGTITYTPYDYKIALINVAGEEHTCNAETEKCLNMLDYIPTSKYILSETSYCETRNGNGIYAKDDSITLSFAGGVVSTSVSKKQARCYLYFVKDDTEKPVIENVETSVTATSITVTVTASDNKGVEKYYYVIDGGTPIEQDTNEYTFTGLTTGQSYEITVYVKDESDNESDKVTKTVVAEKGGPDFSVIATEDEGVFKAIDDTGKESYYYRGAVTNNYLKFANKWWRIIRVNGDGTIRIIYDGTSYHANGESTHDRIAIADQTFNAKNDYSVYVGFMYGQTGSYLYLHSNTSKSNAMTQLETWYKNNLSSYASKIDTNAGFCGDRTFYSGNGFSDTYYAAYGRLVENKEPSLECPDERDFYTVTSANRGNKAMPYPIGLITADEFVLAGGSFTTANKEFFLYSSVDCWTMTPYAFAYTLGSNSSLVTVVASSAIGHLVQTQRGIRPVINLRADVTITGNGTQNDPYVVTS